jgi:hypothetical protein
MEEKKGGREREKKRKIWNEREMIERKRDRGRGRERTKAREDKSERE